jgi:hypothetical protein
MASHIWMWDRWIGLSSSMLSLNISALSPQLGAFKKKIFPYVLWKGGNMKDTFQNETIVGYSSFFCIVVGFK